LFAEEANQGENKQIDEGEEMKFWFLENRGLNNTHHKTFSNL